MTLPVGVALPQAVAVTRTVVVVVVVADFPKLYPAAVVGRGTLGAPPPPGAGVEEVCWGKEEKFISYFPL